MEMKYVVPADQEGRQLRKFVEHLGYSSGLWRRIKWNGEVRINDVPCHHARTIVHAGDTIFLSWKEENEIKPSAIPLSILYEDDYLLVVDKGKNMMIHPTAKEEQGTLVNAVAYYFEEHHIEAGIHPVYRLDRNTTGVCVVAKSSHVQYELSKSHDMIYREYIALAEGKVEPKMGMLSFSIGRKPKSIVEWMVREDGKEAITEYEVLKQTGEVSVLKIHLRTGRTHQIRVHFAHIGHPLLGDDLYGGKQEEFSSQALHAMRVKFVHPITGKEMIFEAPLPEDMKRVIERIGP